MECPNSVPAVRGYEARVRLSECAPGGGLFPHRILEWMQEAAAHASSEAGYPQARYRAMGAAWFIREVILSIEGTAPYGQPIVVQTWVSDLRRFRSRREYVARAGDRVVASGQADWFFLSVSPETSALRPRRPDEEMKAAFPLRPVRAVSPDRVPVWPAASGIDGADLADRVDRADRAEHVVQPLEIDHNDHVNHIHYARWVDNHAQSLGAPPLSALRLHYENDARPGERLVLLCMEIEGGTYHEVRRGSDRLVRAVARRG